MKRPDKRFEAALRVETMAAESNSFAIGEEKSTPSYPGSFGLSACRTNARAKSEGE